MVNVTPPGPQPTIYTERLILRPVNESDHARIVAVASDRRVADTTITVPHPFTDADGHAWIERCRREWEQNEGAHFAIATKERPDYFLGYLAVKDFDHEHDNSEMSGWIDRDVESKGLVTEASRALVDWAFATLPINRITAWNMVRNPASGRVLEKLGFTREGCLRQMVRKWGVYEDVHAWSLLRGDSVS